MPETTQPQSPGLPSREEAGDRVRRFRIEGRLGEGSGGEVFLVRDPLCGTRFALKRLSTRSDPNHEFSVLARLRHPCVVQVREFDRDEAGQPFFTMEYLPGAGDAERLRRMPLGELYALAGDLLRGLSYLHDQGVVHADLKPENIYLPRRGGPARLLDLGLAALRSNDTARPRGTLDYVAPEVLEGAAPDARSDLYSLGVVLFEALTGATPWAGLDAGALLHSKLSGVVGGLRSARPDLSAAVEEVILGLLQKSPEARYRSAAEVAGALREAAGLPDGFGSDHTTGGNVGRARFVGRSGLLAQLAMRLGWPEGDAAQTRGGGVWLHGEAGIGKSRLLEEIAVRARMRGHLVLPLCVSPGTPLTAAASELLGLALPGAREGVSAQEQCSAHLTRLAAALAREAERRPVLVIVDDADEADRATLEWLRLLGIEGEGARLSVLAAARSQRDAPRSLRALGVPPMDRTELRALVTAALGEVDQLAELVRLLEARCGGQPLLLEEDLQGLVVGGALQRRGHRWIPDLGAVERADAGLDVRQKLLRRLCRVSPSATAALRVAAVLGPQFDLGAFRALVGEHADSALGELCGRGILQAGAQQAHFAQSLAQEALYEDLEPGERRRIHDAAFRALSDGPEPAWVKLRHALGGEHRAAALALAHRAADIAASGLAFQEAADILERASQVALGDAAEGLSEDALVVLHARLGEFRLKAGAPATAAAALSQALALVPEGCGELALQLGCAQAAAGNHSEALDAFAEARRRSLASRPQRRELRFAEAWSLLMQGNFTEAERRADAALDALDTGEDAAAAAALLRLKGTVAWHSGRYDEARARLEAAARRARLARADRELAEATLGIGTVLQYQGQLAAAAQACRRAAEIFAELGLPAGEAKALNNQGVIAYLRGRWGEAQELWERFLHIAERLGSQQEQVHGANNLGTLYKDRGELEKAIRTFEAGITLASAIGYSRFEAMLYGNLGEALAAAGRMDEAEAALDRCVALCHELGARGELVEARRREGELALLRRDPRRALQIARKVLSHLGEAASAQERANLLRVVGEAQSELGALGDAQRDIEAAVAIFEEHDQAYELAVARVSLARVRRLAGRTEAAAELLEPAVEVFERLGARARLEVARRELEACRQDSRREGGAPGRLWTLLELGAQLATIEDRQQLLKCVVEAALEVTRYERGFVVIYERDGRPEMQVACNMDAGELDSAAGHPSRTVAQQVYMTGRSIGSTSLSDDERFGSKQSIASLGLRGVRCVPLRVREQVRGVLYVDSRGLGSEAVDADLRLLEMLAATAALALDALRLQAEDRRKTQLIGKLSHEMAGPLTAMVGFADGMVYDDDLPELHQESAQIIAAQGRRLGRLSKTMTQLARYGSGQIPLDAIAIPLEHLLESAVSQLRPLWCGKDLELRVESEPGVPDCVCDPDKVMQVVVNLLGNAVKFTPAGGPIVLRARTIARDAEAVPIAGASWERRLGPWRPGCDPERVLRVEVEDGGPGIAPEEREGIFEPFVQSRHHGEPHGEGSGLGLSISREIVAAHGGRIWVEEGSEGGARFCFELPAVQVDDGTQSPGDTKPEVQAVS